MKTSYVIEQFLKNKRRNYGTLKRYKTILTPFMEMYPEMPTKPFEINEWLSTIKGSSSNLAVHYSVIRAIYKFAFLMELIITDPFEKLHSPKIETKQRRIWTPAELTKIIDTAKPGIELLLILTLIDSTCRIGALGRHQVKPGEWYPGINVSNFNSDHFTANEKTGERKYRLDPQIIEQLHQLADKEGFIFHSSKGKVYSSHDLAKLVTRLIKRAGITGSKLGAHTFRHTSGSIVAKATRSALAVKALLGHDKIDTSMLYIHNAEADIQQEISPLKLAGQTLDNLKARHASNNQPRLMITDGEVIDSTALVPFQEAPEIVEGTVDLSEELFPEIPETLPKVHTYLSAKDLKVICKVSRYYSKYAPIDGTTGELSAMFKRWLKFSKKELNIQPKTSTS